MKCNYNDINDDDTSSTTETNTPTKAPTNAPTKAPTTTQSIYTIKKDNNKWGLIEVV